MTASRRPRLGSYRTVARGGRPLVSLLVAGGASSAAGPAAAARLSLARRGRRATAPGTQSARVLLADRAGPRHRPLGDGAPRRRVRRPRRPPAHLRGQARAGAARAPGSRSGHFAWVCRGRGGALQRDADHARSPHGAGVVRPRHALPLLLRRRPGGLGGLLVARVRRPRLRRTWRSSPASRRGDRLPRAPSTARTTGAPSTGCGCPCAIWARSSSLRFPWRGDHDATKGDLLPVAWVVVRPRARALQAGGGRAHLHHQGPLRVGLRARAPRRLPAHRPGRLGRRQRRAGTLLVDPPPEIEAGSGERWIDVDLQTQTLVAYEGRRPVFKPRSCPRAGVSRAARWASPRGTHRVWIKLLTSDMDNLEDVNASRYYRIEDVPWESSTSPRASGSTVPSGTAPSDRGAQPRLREPLAARRRAALLVDGAAPAGRLDGGVPHRARAGHGDPRPLRW